MKYKCQKCGDENYLSETIIVTAYKSRSCDYFNFCKKCYAKIIKGINPKDVK